MESPTTVVKAVCDLVTNDHADAAIVEGIALAFAEEWQLEDSCWEHWERGGERKTQDTRDRKYNLKVCFFARAILKLPIWFLLVE